MLERFLSVFILFTFCSDLCAANTIAFPGAEGFGKYTKGGRGGRTIIVTNLNDSGPGSLREAIESEGPRIILFEVSGIIDLETQLQITNPFVTIAGQSAPGAGIIIRGNYIRIAASEVIIRFLRIRPGDVSFGQINNWGGLDAIGIGGENYYNNIIIDHCSFSWAVDEVVGLWGNAYNITIQNSIISEGLYNSKHPKGPHSKGVLTGLEMDSVSIINNLIIHNMERNPRISNAGIADIRNNIIYNPGNFAAKISNTNNIGQKVNFVRNIFIPGPDTRFTREFAVWMPSRHNGKIFLKENVGFDGDYYKDNWDMVEDWITRTPLRISVVNQIMSEVEFEHNVSYTRNYEEMQYYTQKYIGASLPIRDNVDRRLIYELNNRSGNIIDSQIEVGGWPGPETGFVKIPHDSNGKSNYDKHNGIPIEWLNKYNILPGEENLDFNGNGYTNIEEYLNGTNPRNDSAGSPLDVFDMFSSISATYNNGYQLMNAPNPFNHYTRIWFTISDIANVNLTIIDRSGKVVKHLVNAEILAGNYEFIWIPEGIMPGLYLAIMQIDGKTRSSLRLLYL